MPSFTSYSWFLTGPTAVGKSALAVEIAERLGCEIIAMDSMTLYRGMDIGTDKPSPEDRARVPHHLIDVLDPWESASLEQYLKMAEAAAVEIRSRDKQPLFVGGTPLYLKACLRGVFHGPAPDPNLRDSLKEQAERHGTAYLHSRLAMVDPKAASRIPPGDVRRVLRALEVFEQTGRPISDWQEQFDQPASPAPKVGCIVRPRAELHGRINDRVHSMLQSGWIDEVRRLLSMDPPLSRVARQAAGYSEWIDHIEGRLPLEEIVPRVQARTRQLCKRQMTWFRHIAECTMFECSDRDVMDSVTQRLTNWFDSKQ